MKDAKVEERRAKRRKGERPMVNFSPLLTLLLEILRAPLGAYDGNIYEHYYLAATNSRVNKTVAPYWDELVKPRTQYQPQSKL